MHYRLLGLTGLNVSVLGLGGSPLGGVFGAVDEAEGVRIVRTALDCGVNFLDVAPFYGNTRAEAVLGRALRGVPRHSYILATKVGQYCSGEFDFSASRVTRSFDDSCARLGVEYVDLLQCHDIEYADLGQIVGETLPALVRLREAGRIGHIGITGLPLKIFRAVIDQVSPGTVETALSFCRYTLNDSALTALLPYLTAKRIGVINAAVTGMGLLTDGALPPWHPATPAMIAGARRAVELCQRRGQNIVTLAIQFSISNPSISATLVGAVTEEQVRENVRAADSPIDFELMAEVLKELQPIKDHNFMRGRPENRDLLIP